MEQIASQFKDSGVDANDKISEIDSNQPTGKNEAMSPLNFPIFNILLSVVQVILFYNGGAPGDLGWLLICYDPFRRHEIWRYLTVCLVHINDLHLWSNVSFQLFVGVLLERSIGWRKTLAIFCSGVFTGSLFSNIAIPQDYGCGASDGNYAILFAYHAITILSWKTIKNKCGRLFLFTITAVADTIYLIYMELILGVNTEINFYGHFVGALCGVCVSILLFAKFRNSLRSRRFRNFVCLASVVLFSTVIFINIFYPSLYLRTEWNTDYLNSRFRYMMVKERVTVGMFSNPNSEMYKVCSAVDVCRETILKDAKKIDYDFAKKHGLID